MNALVVIVTGLCLAVIGYTLYRAYKQGDIVTFSLGSTVKRANEPIYFLVQVAFYLLIAVLMLYFFITFWHRLLGYGDWLNSSRPGLDSSWSWGHATLRPTFHRVGSFLPLNVQLSVSPRPAPSLSGGYQTTLRALSTERHSWLTRKHAGRALILIVEFDTDSVPQLSRGEL